MNKNIKNDEIEEALKSETVTTIKDLKEKSGYKKDGALLNSLLCYLKQAIYHYKYEDDNRHLLKTMPLIKELINRGRVLKFDKTKGEIAKIRVSIKSKLITKPNSISKEAINYQILKRLYEALELIDIQLDFDMNADHKGSNYQFLSYIVFGLQDFSYFEQTINKIPALINATNLNGESLYYNVVLKALEEIEDHPDDKNTFHYYERIMSYFQSRGNFLENGIEKEELLSRLYEFLETLDYSVPYYKEKRECLGFLKRKIEHKSNQSNSLNELLAKYDISSSFPSYIEEEEKIISSRIFPRFFRERDLVRDYAITIDRKGALELDDALSAKILPNGNYLLGIHIADILGVVPFNSFSVQEALDQTTAIYFFCQRKISLFPKDIVETASLSERKYHLTKSYYFEIDKHGNYQVLPAARSITFINKNTTYSDINRILANGCYNNKLLETSILLDEITSSLQKKDPINPLYLALKDEDVDISHNREDHTKAGNIVRYSMLMLNKTVPLFFSNNGFPFLYRVQNMDPKAEETLNRIYQELPKDNTDPRYQQLMTQAKSIYGAARYDIKGSHSGLGLEHYCHISSTLRRSADIVASFCENKCYFNTPTDEDLQFLEKLVLSNAKHINAKKRGINDCYREYTQLENDKKALTTPKIMIK